MRVFFALTPPPPTKLAIEAWREKAFPHFISPVKASNFHITLAFLGQISEPQLDTLSQYLDSQLNIKSFSLTLDYLGYWSKPKALWIGNTHVPKPQLDLVELLYKAAQNSGISVQKRDYISHLTLARKCHENPPAPLLEPSFTFKNSEVTLYQSVSTDHGVMYRPLAEWTFVPSFSF
ncbi:RNA 2',3'-cyclic phosphodiesterase [Paraglaciecola sp. 20A4]|uniref:RNA 2',3'-cyclic phosphodiesterase n=1 Tax=Paraglaciecola sp. 20A4 TaxID=2687288 RepID=UPI00140E3177|nr:RNA 2',3'-cyclic phosphodiesterase [Paraglaciecola sp. 20A4]